MERRLRTIAGQSAPKRAVRPLAARPDKPYDGAESHASEKGRTGNMFETRITKLFNIKYPIICGGMYWLSRAELIAAVANAGGLGFITAATFPELEDLRAEIRKARDLTDKPIGLNINLFPAARPQPVEEWARG